MLVNRKIPTDHWFQVELGSFEITMVQVQMQKGLVLLVNMYNDNANMVSVHKVSQYIRNKEQERGVWGVNTHIIWLGDFKSHHPLWDEARNSHLFMWASLDRAQKTIEVVANYDLQMI